MSSTYALYLVTDSTPDVLGSKDLIDVVRRALEGGVTIVQYRDKHSDSKHLIETAQSLHALTKEHGVPLIINDRVDVALAVGAEGVHLGQDDMDLATARKILGPSAIIGISCSNPGEAERAAKGGADYLGIGTIFPTATKTDVKEVIGVDGCRTILKHLASFDLGAHISTVAIGGINTSNVDQIMTESASFEKYLNGVAIVSAIVAAADEKAAAQNLRSLVLPLARSQALADSFISKLARLNMLENVRQILEKVYVEGPLCHNMTNLVVQNFVANVTLAIGGKPIMSSDGREAEDLAALGGSLVINMGTADEATMDNFLIALQAYNKQGRPIVLDPVGAGATKVRRSNLKRLLNGGKYSVIKGNASEIQAASGNLGEQQRGVESNSSLTFSERAGMVRMMAIQTRSVVLMTGATDFLSDGHRTMEVKNGHPLLGRITGAGCALGSVIAACLAVEKGPNKFAAALAGLLLYNIAAERAVGGRKEDEQDSSHRLRVEGSGTFVPAFIDSLGELASTVAATSHETSWLGSADFLRWQ